MSVLRVDIERALDEIVSNEGGMQFQGLAVVLGKLVWSELRASERKKDLGLDAYASAAHTTERVGKGLASSITPTYRKLAEDAGTAKKHFSDLQWLLFVTSAKVGNKKRLEWTEALKKTYGLDLQIMSREDIILTLMIPQNASLLASFLRLPVSIDAPTADLLERTRRAAEAVSQAWAAKNKGGPLIELSATRIEASGIGTSEVLSLADIASALADSKRIVLEGPAGCGKTTTLVQLAQINPTGRIALLVDLPGWARSGQRILDYLVGMPSFQARRIEANHLTALHESQPFWFLLNGWNEIAESNSSQANEALAELERSFPKAGIAVATRTHHLTPPLPGGIRLRFLPLSRQQRAGYLAARLGDKAGLLRTRLTGEPVLDALTRTPFILSEVVSLFAAGAAIPETKTGVLAAVIRLQEEGEHRNALHAAPLSGCQRNYLEALAIEMTRSGAISLPETRARAIVGQVARQLGDSGQISGPKEPTDILAALTAHHVLERLDYPETTFRFQHQQFQEHYATLGILPKLISLRPGDTALQHFAADYVNQTAWYEPLRMIAETLGRSTGNAETDRQNVRAGRLLLEMALVVEPLFAAELAQLCGDAVWTEIGGAVGARLRNLYSFRDKNYRQCALAAMLATGSSDFGDIVVPLLAADDQQERLSTYRLWSEIEPTIVGPDWREKVRTWSDHARADFVSELLHYRFDAGVAAFAEADSSPAVKKAAISALTWNRVDDAAICVLESMNAETFDEVARDRGGYRIPAALRPKAVESLRRCVEQSTDQSARLRAAIDMLELGERSVDGVIKEALNALPREEMDKLTQYYIKPALEHLRGNDPTWVSEWVAVRLADGALWHDEFWMTFVTHVPETLLTGWLERLETEDLENKRFSGIVTVLAVSADVRMAQRLFTKIRQASGTKAPVWIPHSGFW